MEPRNYEAGAVEAPPAAPETPSVGFPIAGNPITGTPATKPGPFWIYKMGESLRRVIVSEGLTPSDDDLDLLLNAINAKSKPSQDQATWNEGVVETESSIAPDKLQAKLNNYRNLFVLGFGQTRQNLTASRALNVTYTNSTDRPRLVSIIMNVGAGQSFSFLIDGVLHLSSGNAATTATGQPMEAIVFPGETYQVSGSGVSISKWSEA